MLGIGLGVVMEKYYKFNGRDVTGDELVSLVHCLTAEGQKAQTKCAQVNDALRDSKMECIKLEERLTESRRENASVSRTKWSSSTNRRQNTGYESVSRPYTLLV